MPPLRLSNHDELSIPAYFARDGEDSPELQQWLRDHPDSFVAGRWTGRLNRPSPGGDAGPRNARTTGLLPTQASAADSARMVEAQTGSGALASPVSRTASERGGTTDPNPPLAVQTQSGETIRGAEGRPALQPTLGHPLSWFADAGEYAHDLDPDNNLVALAQLLNFRTGDSWDQQRLVDHSSVDQRYVDYATIAIGVYGAAAGIPIGEILLLQDLWAAHHSHFGNAPMDEKYKHLAKRNVENTMIGYDLYRRGRIPRLP